MSSGRNVSECPGNGPDLAIVKAILTAHGGSVAVQSDLMKGAQMIISLPVPGKAQAS